MNAVVVDLPTSVTPLKSFNFRRLSGAAYMHPAPTLWLTIAPDPVTRTQNFSSDLAREFRQVLTEAADPGRPTPFMDRDTAPPPYVVLQSSHPQYFNLGGDLPYMLSAIKARDEDSLRHYSIACLDLMHLWATMLHDPTTTISLIQGRTLGGGFEMALATDYIVAERKSTFGFPEVMFGLFPCTGAMTLLTQRISVRAAERMIGSPRVWSAQEMLDAGIIDEICDDGEGELAVERFIARHNRRRKAMLKIQQARHRATPFNYNECLQVVEDWVETALQLTNEEIRSLEMLVMMQRSEAVSQPQSTVGLRSAG